MHNQRSGGITAIGILNIVFGSLRGIFALVTIIGGGMMAALGSAAGADGGASFATAGGAIAVIGLVALVYSIMLLIAGIGVLMMKPWGRGLSIAAASLWLITAFGSIVMLGTFGITTIVGMVYPAVVVGLFMTPAWRSAFAGQPGAVATSADEPFVGAASSHPSMPKPGQQPVAHSNMQDDPARSAA